MAAPERGYGMGAVMGSGLVGIKHSRIAYDPFTKEFIHGVGDASDAIITDDPNNPTFALVHEEDPTGEKAAADNARLTNGNSRVWRTRLADLELNGLNPNIPNQDPVILDETMPWTLISSFCGNGDYRGEIWDTMGFSLDTNRRQIYFTKGFSFGDSFSGACSDKLPLPTNGGAVLTLEDDYEWQPLPLEEPPSGWGGDLGSSYSVYDAATDSLYRFRSGPVVEVWDLQDNSLEIIPIGLQTSPNRKQPVNSFDGNLWIMDDLARELKRYNIAQKAIVEAVPVPESWERPTDGDEGTWVGEGYMVYDSINNAVVNVATRSHGFGDFIGLYIYYLDTETWEFVAGPEGVGVNVAGYNKAHNVIFMTGRNPGESSVWLYRLGGGTPQTTCGNGQVDSGEQCDDGNTANNDGCSNTCQVESNTRNAEMWEYEEWSLDNPTWSGNPFDVIATVTFTHQGSNEVRTTEMFYDGSNTWKFRFTGTQTGTYTYTTSSTDPELDGHTGTVQVAAQTDPNIKGFLTIVGNKFALPNHEGELQGYLFNAYMDGTDFSTGGPQPGILDDPLLSTWTLSTMQDYIDQAKQQGFINNPLHIHVNHQWFDETAAMAHNVDDFNTPDLNTFSRLESFIELAHSQDMRIHFWMWGDHERAWTPIGEAGGINGVPDQRLQRYIAARLGPLPGWSMGYGFDLQEWVNNDQLGVWAANMHNYMGWDHMLAARGFDHLELDLVSYSNLNYPYDAAVLNLDSDTTRPHFFEERDLYTRSGNSMDVTRQHLWQYMIAGGHAGFWGRMWAGGPLYPNPEQIDTFHRFTQNRFLLNMVRANELTSQYALRSSDNQHFIFYAENTGSIPIDLSSMSGSQPAIAIDTKLAYSEINLGTLSATDQNWNAPYNSDWVVAVGDFDSTTLPPTDPICGNNIVESGEQCDDGNTIDGDGCSSTCQNEVLSCLPEDVNGDDVVNVFDLLTVVSVFGTSDSTGDVNNDNTVNVFDLLSVAQQLGQTSANCDLCSNGEQDVGEEGVDCGGDCPACTGGTVQVTNLGNSFELGITQVGEEFYTDREYTLTMVPTLLQNTILIRTPNDGKANSEPDYLTFSLSEAATVYVAFDSRATSLPLWLSSWTSVSEVLETSDVDFELYEKDFVGSVTLGGNDQASTNAHSTYIVIVGAPAQPPEPCDDIDNDGYCNEVDCNDNNANINPGAEEICDDGIDNDCSNGDDPVTTYYVDADSDGYGTSSVPSTEACTKPAGHVANSADCNDNDDGIHPGASEICEDGIDNDCFNGDKSCSSTGPGPNPFGIAANTWVKVPNSKYADSRPPSYTFGSYDQVNGIFDPWCGGAYNFIDGKLFFNCGGHADGMDDRGIEADVAAMKEHIENPSSTTPIWEHLGNRGEHPCGSSVHSYNIAFVPTSDQPGSSHEYIVAGGAREPDGAGCGEVSIFDPVTETWRSRSDILNNGWGLGSNLMENYEEGWMLMLGSREQVGLYYFATGIYVPLQLTNLGWGWNENTGTLSGDGTRFVHTGRRNGGYSDPMYVLIVDSQANTLEISELTTTGPNPLMFSSEFHGIIEGPGFVWDDEAELFVAYQGNPADGNFADTPDLYTLEVDWNAKTGVWTKHTFQGEPPITHYDMQSDHSRGLNDRFMKVGDTYVVPSSVDEDLTLIRPVWT